jgi:hypothetical protein
MKDAAITWGRILELAAALDGFRAGAEDRLELARLVIEFDRDIVRHPLREQAGDAPREPQEPRERLDEEPGVADAADPDTRLVRDQSAQ